MTFSPGELIAGKYRIVRVIGEGGMGAVYEARHELLGTSVALKFLHSDLAERPGLAARFLQEARVSATIQSPHVARVTDVDTSQDGAPYLVMELLHGESLQKRLDREHSLNPDQAIDFTLQILSGLEAAHALGVVHRDLKPDNVFVTPTNGGGPLLKLIDFGIAKLRETSEFKKGLTRAGVVMGTAEYMAPEQLYAANEVDLRADIYSLGVMLFEMLTGVRPADGESVEAIVANVLSGRVRRLAELAPHLKPGLSGIVERAIAADRNQRYSSAHELRTDLARYAGELSHAGHLAAQVLPLAHESAPPNARAQSVAPTAFAPPQNARFSSTVDGPAPVPRTLPPEAPAAPTFANPRGGTQAAPAFPGIPPISPPAFSPPRASKRRRSRAWLIALGTSFVLVTLAVVAGALVERTKRFEVVPTLPLPEPNIPGAKNIEPIVIPTSPETVTAPSPETRERKTLPTSTARPKTTTEGGAPGIQPLPFPSFALPSSLPPLPSTFPKLPATLPSFFPQIPGLTVPGATQQRGDTGARAP